MDFLLCLGVHLQLTHVSYAKKFFSRPGDALAPIAPPGYAHGPMELLQHDPGERPDRQHISPIRDTLVGCIRLAVFCVTKVGAYLAFLKCGGCHFMYSVRRTRCVYVVFTRADDNNATATLIYSVGCCSEQTRQ